MTARGVQTWIITAIAVLALGWWVARSNRHVIADFELDCTGPPEPPASVDANVAANGVTIHWTLDPDPQISTSYVVEARSAAAPQQPLVFPVPRGIDRTTQP